MTTLRRWTYQVLLWCGLIKPVEWHMWTVSQDISGARLYKDGELYDGTITINFWLGTPT